MGQQYAGDVIGYKTFRGFNTISSGHLKACKHLIVRGFSFVRFPKITEKSAAMSTHSCLEYPYPYSSISLKC